MIKIFKKCNHKNACVPVRFGHGLEIAVGWFCLKCHKFWVRDDLKEVLKKYPQFKDVVEE
ncbi:hypothetical protein DRJ16_00095 [Candidatus Woesearchaeota archaeon]|nr:MAG: hypothetical protein DRJ16_00095 [Candidatus Woesearchaeota archaeon]